MKSTVWLPAGTVADFGVLPRGRPSRTRFDGGSDMKVSVALPAAGAGAGAGVAAGPGRGPGEGAGTRGPCATGPSEDELVSIRFTTNVFSAWPSSKSMRFS